jgi:hypothetical protein
MPALGWIYLVFNVALYFDPGQVWLAKKIGQTRIRKSRHVQGRAKAMKVDHPPWKRPAAETQRQQSQLTIHLREIEIPDTHYLNTRRRSNQCE